MFSGKIERDQWHEMVQPWTFLELVYQGEGSNIKKDSDLNILQK